MNDITFMPNDYIVTHIKTDTICEHFSNDDVVYVIDERIVPLVRCKECRYEDDCEQEVLLSEMYGEIADTAHITYCSYGEREGE